MIWKLVKHFSFIGNTYLHTTFSVILYLHKRAFTLTVAEEYYRSSTFPSSIYIDSFGDLKLFIDIEVGIQLMKRRF